MLLAEKSLLCGLHIHIPKPLIFFFLLTRLQLYNVCYIVKCLRIDFAVSLTNLTNIGQNSAYTDTGDLAAGEIWPSTPVSWSHRDVSSTLAVLVCFMVG